jgi:hypothetical protein
MEGGEMETWRRGILLACVCLAIWAAKYASLKPVISLRQIDFAEKQKNETQWTEEGRRLSLLGGDDYIAEKSKEKLAAVAGPEWERFFAGLRAADAGAAHDREWTSRVPADELRFDYSPKSFFFWPTEPPVAQIADRFRAGGDSVYLAATSGGRTSYLEATYNVYSSEDFHFGSGFSRNPKPPARFLFPFRKYALGIALAGLAVYFVLPRRRREKNAILYPPWRNALGDFASLLLIVPFFGLPFLVVGGAVQALTQGWILCLIFWPLALMGVWLLQTMAWYAGYRILLREDGLIVEAGKKELSVPFADMTGCRPLVLTAPRWLVRMTALAALGGRGASRMGSAGRAFLLAGSSYGGLGIGLKDGSSVFFWVTDAMGTEALKNAGRMMKMLEKAGVPRNDEPETIRSVALPTGKDRAGKIVKQGSEKVLGIFAVFPILVMLILLLIVLFGGGH